MATANQDSLLAASKQEKKFTVPKNLLMVTGLILIVIVIFVFAGKTAMDEQPTTAIKLKPESAGNVEPAPEIFENTVREQTNKGNEIAKKAEIDAARKNEMNPPVPTPINGAGFPEAGKNGEIVLSSAPPMTQQQSAAQQAQARRDSDMAAREMMIRDSKIMAIESDSDSPNRQTSGTSAETDDITNRQNELQSTMQKIFNPLASAAAPAAGGGSQSKAKGEREWMKENAQFTDGQEVSRGYAPPSRFMLLQGKTINAVLRTAINTDLPGEIQATVLTDIYDSISGNYLLIPKGSTLVGVYNSDIKVGQDRVNMGFKRLILPNGISVTLPGNIGMDSSGMSGVPGSVNNHYAQMFFVSTLTAIGAFASQKTQQATSGTTVNTSPQQTAAGQILIDMNNAILERNRVIGPTITIPAGIRIAINVARDIELPPFKK